MSLIAETTTDSSQTPSARQFLTLPNGKRLAYVDFGPKQGDPILLLHGAHGSATYFSHFPGYPYGTRWRMIGVDRPGYGESDMWTHGYRELAVALASLCKHLELDHVRVLGVSAGGACALACGVVFPSSIRQIVAISPICPLSPQIMHQVNRTNRVIYWLARHLPTLSRVNANFIARVSRDKMESFMERSKGKFSAADRRELEKVIVRHVLIASAKEAYPHGSGRGLAQDLENQANALDFDPREIAAETHIWASEDDTSAPPVMAKFLHDRVQQSYLHLVPDAGHLWHICNLQKILEQSLE